MSSSDDDDSSDIAATDVAVALVVVPNPATDNTETPANVAPDVARPPSNTATDNTSQIPKDSAQKGVFRGSNLEPRYLCTGLPNGPAEAGFVHGAPPPLWCRWSEFQIRFSRDFILWYFESKSDLL